MNGTAGLGRETDYEETAQQVVFVCAPLLFIMLLGWLIGYLRLWHEDVMVTIKQLNAFLFFLGIPAAVFRGLARTDLASLDWDFFKAFLFLRLFVGLMVAAATLAYCSWKFGAIRFSMGSFLLHWIATTWINTVIFGIPVLRALYGPQTAILNILAAMSSLLFQFPLMLFCFEWRAIIKGSDPTLSLMKAKDPLKDIEQPTTEPNPTTEPAEGLAVEVDPNTLSASSHEGEKFGASKNALDESDATAAAIFLRLVWKVARRLLTNPPLIGIALGLAYSGLITSLADPSKLHEIPDNLGKWLGDTVQPIAAFSVGLYVNVLSLDVVKRTWKYTAVYLLIKNFLVPLFMIPLLQMTGIDGVNARAGVHIAALPIALASFVLSQQYFKDSSVFSLTIVLGTALILPTALLWEAILNDWGVFSV